MPDLVLVKKIKPTVLIPVAMRSRDGHVMEARVLEAIGVDYFDGSEVIALADEGNFINKHNFRTPFICGCKSLGQALNRIREGVAMIRMQGKIAGCGNIVKTAKNIRSVMGDIRVLNNMDKDDVFAFARRIFALYDLIAQTKQLGRVPVMHFVAGGIFSPADAAMMMQMGCDGVVIGPEGFICLDPYERIHGIVRGVRHYTDPHMLAESSCKLPDEMVGLRIDQERMDQVQARDV